MIIVRRDKDIHDTEGGWFRARWHFSFDTYRDPENDRLRGHARLQRRSTHPGAGGRSTPIGTSKG